VERRPCGLNDRAVVAVFAPLGVEALLVEEDVHAYGELSRDTPSCAISLPPTEVGRPRFWMELSTVRAEYPALAATSVASFIAVRKTRRGVKQTIPDD
jgi:hypothetical protein